MSELMQTAAIGGYFQLELPDSKPHYHQNAQLYQSARAAFRSLLQAGRPRKVFIPKYICDAMISPLHEEKIDYEWYELNDTLDVPNSLALGEEEWLVYVNYFGISQAQVERVMQNFPPDQLVFDFSQAFFDLPVSEALATIYSPRKFFGVPDGGMLQSKIAVNQPSVQDNGSLSRMSHLLKRLNEIPESGYADYLLAEQSIEDSKPMLMSRLTQRLITSIDYEAVKQKRMENFSYLHEKLKSINLLSIPTNNLLAPLCYPLITLDSNLRDKFIKNRIFIPRYWNDATKRLCPETSERMVDRLLPLPIDQRYGQIEMDRMLSLLSDSVHL